VLFSVTLVLGKLSAFFFFFLRAFPRPDLLGSVVVLIRKDVEVIIVVRRGPGAEEAEEGGEPSGEVHTKLIFVEVSPGTLDEGLRMGSELMKGWEGVVTPRT
jgi:hypothetical protein